jgi:hypothetical protein
MMIIKSKLYNLNGIGIKTTSRQTATAIYTD